LPEDALAARPATVQHRSSSVTVHSGLPSRTRSGVDGVDGLDGLDAADGLDGVGGFDGVDGLDGVDAADGVDGLDCGVVWPLVGVVRPANDGNVSASLTYPPYHVV